MQLQNRIEYILLRLIGLIVQAIGLKLSQHLALFLSKVFYYLVPIRKKTAFENIARAFPEKSKSEITKIVKNTYSNFCITLLELLYTPYLSKTEIDEFVHFEKLNRIKELYSKNKGMIFLTAHYGNWEISAVSMTSKIGIPLTVLAKPQRNQLVNDWINKLRSSFGNNIVALGVSIREFYSNIKNGGVVGVVGDQRGPIDGIRVKFFGIDTSTFAGTASIAIKLKLPILIIFLQRNKNFKYSTIVHEIDTEKLDGSTEEKIKFINQTYMTKLEETIRKDPGQWFWMHKIWKY